MHDLLAAAELALSRHCVLQLELPDRMLERLFPARGEAQAGSLSASDLDERVDDASYAALWGPYAGREAELYRDCAEQVDALDLEQVLAIGGGELRLRAELAQRAYTRLITREVPARVRRRELRVLYDRGGSARITTYSQLDPLRVPASLLSALPELDGRPTAEALDAIQRERGLRIHPNVVRKLTDFGVLEEVEEPSVVDAVDAADAGG